MKNQFYQIRYALVVFSTVLLVGGQENLNDQEPLNEVSKENELTVKDGILKFDSFLKI